MSETKRVQEYKNDEITVRFDPNVCAHSAVCIRNLPGVFNLKGRPWINLMGEPTEAITGLIDRCPSGALSYTLSQTPGPDSPQEDSQTVATVLPNGPLRILGPLRLVDGSGQVVYEGDKCLLCRCGASRRKPFCDGSHVRVGFEG